MQALSVRVERVANEIPFYYVNEYHGQRLERFLIKILKISSQWYATYRKIFVIHCFNILEIIVLYYVLKSDKV